MILFHALCLFAVSWHVLGRVFQSPATHKRTKTYSLWIKYFWNENLTIMDWVCCTTYCIQSNMYLHYRTRTYVEKVVEKVDNMRRPERRTAMKVLVKKTFLNLWTIYGSATFSKDPWCRFIYLHNLCTVRLMMLSNRQKSQHIGLMIWRTMVLFYTQMWTMNFNEL